MKNNNSFSNFSKIYRYSPTEAAKVYDKPLSRKFCVEFTPTSTIELLKKGTEKLVEREARRKLVEEYLDVRTFNFCCIPT